MNERYYIEEGIEHAGNYNIIDRETGKGIAMSISGKEKAQKIAARYNATIEALKQEIHNNGIQSQKDERWCKVYLYDETDPSQGYVVEAGYEMMPADWREEVATIEEALSSANDFLPLSEWVASEF